MIEQDIEMGRPIRIVRADHDALPDAQALRGETVLDLQAEPLRWMSIDALLPGSALGDFQQGEEHQGEGDAGEHKQEGRYQRQTDGELALAERQVERDPPRGSAPDRTSSAMR